MSSILFDVQTAVVEALDAVDGLPSVYDHVPPEAAFPYIVYGPVHATPYDAKAETGFEQVITLNIWSRYRGGKQTREIFQKIYEALHRAALSVEGPDTLTSEFHSADFSMDSDGLTYHAAVRFTVVTQGE